MRDGPRLGADVDCPVLFLDFDGVLNSEPWLLPFALSSGDERLGDVDFMRGLIDRRNLAHLQRIVTATAARIVISSSWRETLSLDALRDILSSHGLVAEIPGVTPTGQTRRRAIEGWLAAHPEVTRYVVLDDLDLGPWTQHVHTDVQQGLTDADADRAIGVLLAGQPTAPPSNGPTVDR